MIKPASRLPALAALLLLSSCDNEQVNENAQAGAWHVVQVTATQQVAGQAASTVTVTDPGDFAFEDHASSFNRVVLYLDKPTPSHLQQFYSNGTTLTPRRYDWFWEADPGPAHRLVLRLDEDLLRTFTYKENGTDRKTFFYLERDNKGNIGYREDWTLERLD